MLISVPKKAKEEFIALSHLAYEQPSTCLFELFCRKADGYSQAIKDICGADVWYSIVRDADLSFPEGVDVCAGIPLFRKNDPIHEKDKS